MCHIITTTHLHEQHRWIGARAQHAHHVGMPHALERPCLIDEQLRRRRLLFVGRAGRHRLHCDVAPLPAGEVHRAETAAAELAK